MNREILNQKEYWNREVKAFDSIYSAQKSNFSKWLDKVLRWDIIARFEYTINKSEPIHDKTFLDVGCGTGVFSLEYARRNAKQVTGIDIAEQMINVCISRAEKEGLSARCKFLNSDLLEFKSDKMFDVCIGIGLFDYIKKPLSVICKMHDVVNDRIIVTFPRFWTWRAPVRKFRLWLRHCAVYFYTKKRIKILLKTAGFNHFDIDTIGKLFCVTAYLK
jgi:2-polyprenyl-3-methyl-5-hydroxy-6-metoxy-1,4-benzoquinol methylase